MSDANAIFMKYVIQGRQSISPSLPLPLPLPLPHLCRKNAEASMKIYTEISVTELVKWCI